MPVGTLVSTTNADQAFQTVAPLTIAGVLSSTAEVDVVALEAGPQNNVEAEAISRIGDPFAELVTVTNPEPLSGGDVSEVATVTGEDRERLRSQVLQFLQAVAVAEMETTLSEREFLARDSIRVVTVERETYSQQVGDRSDSVRLKLEARLQGTAIDLTEAAGLAYDSLAGQVGEGFNLIVDSITYHQNEVLEADKDGRVVFLMHSEGLVAADFELETLVVTISGQTPEVATAYLYEVLPLRDVPGIDVWPQWFKRLPYKSNRIDVAIITGD
jgi:hypothetical protein